MKRFRKAMSALLALAMLVGLLPAVATPAAAETTYNVKVKKSDASSYTTLYEGVTLPLGSTDNSSDIGINIISPYAPEIAYYAGTETSSSNTAVAELGNLSASLAHHICIKGVGTTKITYTGVPAFTSDTNTYSFYIKVESASKPISDCAISVSDVTYDGAPHQQSVTITDGTKTLVQDTDYTVSYPDSDYTNAGTKNVSISGMGGYSGSTTKTFTITKAAGTISYATGTLKKYLGKDGAFTNALTKTGDGSVSYGSSDQSVATVASDGKVTIKGAGSATITATVADSANYAYAVKTASYTLNVWEPKMISVDTHITEESLPSGTAVNTAGWTVTAYYAAKTTALPAETESEEGYNFAADPNWDVVSGVTPFKVNGNAPATETLSKDNRTFAVTYSTAPAETVEIPLSPYTLTAVSANGEVIFTVSGQETDGAYEGQTPVTMEVVPDDGYAVSGITVKCGNDTVATEGTGNTRTFTMPAGNVTATVSYNENKYAITATAAENGTYTATVNSVAATEAVPGSVVTIAASPAEGYGLKGFTVTKTGSDPAETVDDFGTGFVMPEYPVTISAEFEALPADTATAWRLLNPENYPAGSTLYTGRYYLTEDVTFDGSSIGNGLKIARNAIVYIYLNDHTLTATGKAASGMNGGFAGIYLPGGATLYFVGDGAVNAVGGNAAAGANGAKGSDGYAYASCSSGLAGYLGGTSTSARGGKGGAGGNGGGGAGAGIGTNGTSGATASTTQTVKTNTTTPETAGTVNLLGNVSLAGSKGGENGQNGANGASGANQKKTDSFKRWPFKTKKCSAFGGGGAGGSGGQGGFGGAIVGAGGKGGNGGAKGGNGNKATSNKNHNASAAAATAAGVNGASSASTLNGAVQYYLRGINADTTAQNNLFAVGATITGAEGDVLDTLTLRAYYTKTQADTMANYGGNTDTDWAAIAVPQDKVSTVSLTNQTNADGAIVAGGNNVLVSYDPGSVSDPITAELNVAGEQKNTDLLGAAGNYKDIKTVKFATYDNAAHQLTALNDFSDSWNATYAVLYTPYHTFKDNKVTNKDGSAAPAEFALTTPYSNANNWLLGGADSAAEKDYFTTAGKYFSGTAYAPAAEYSAWLGNYTELGKVQIKNAGLYTVYERVLDWEYTAQGVYTPTYKYNAYYVLIEQADLAIDQATDAVYEPTKVQDHRFTRFVEGQNGEEVYGTFSFDANYGENWGNDEHLMLNAATPLQRDLQWEFNLFGDLTGVKDAYTDSDRATIAYGSKNMNNYLCQNDGKSAEDQKTSAGDVQNTYYQGKNGAISYRNQTVDPDPAPSGVNVIPGAMEITVNYVGTQAAANTDPGKSAAFTPVTFKSEAVTAGYPDPNYAKKSDGNTISSVYAEDLKVSGKLTRNDLGWRVVKGDKISGDTPYGNKVTAAPNAAYTADLIDGDAYSGDLYVITVQAGDETVATIKYTDTTATNSVANVVSKLAEQVSDQLPACEFYGVDDYTVTVDYYGLYYTTETSTAGRAAAWSGEEEFQWVVTGVRFYLDVAQRELTLKDTGDFDKIYDGATALVSQTVTDGDVTAAGKYVTELTTAAPAAPGQFAKQASAALYNYLDPTGTNVLHMELAGDYADKNKGADKSVTITAARFLKADDTVPAAGDKVAALNYAFVDGNGTAEPETDETRGIAAVTGSVDVAQMHFTHAPFGVLTVYDLTALHKAFDLHAKAYLLTATTENGFYSKLEMKETELVEADDDGTDSYGKTLTEYDYAVTYAINDTVKYDQYMTDKTLTIDGATGAITHVAQRSIGSTNPANFPAMNVSIGSFPNFKLVSADTADLNLNACTQIGAQNSKTASAESWQHVMRFRVKGNANNYDLLLPLDQLNARPVPSAFINRSGGVVKTADEAESYKYITLYPNGDAAEFEFTIPQNSYLADVKIVAVKVGDPAADYKTTENAAAPIPSLAALLADTANEIGAYSTQAVAAVADDPETTDVDETVAAGMNHIANPLWLKLLKVNGADASTLAAANDQLGGSTFRFELRTGDCDLGESYAIAIVPVVESFNGKLLGDHEDVTAPDTAYASNISVEKTVTSETDSTLSGGANDNVYINYKTLFNTTAYGSDAAAFDGYAKLAYKAPDADGVINGGAEAEKQITLGANGMGKFNSLAIDTEADTAFFDPAKLLPGTEVTADLYLWRDGAVSGLNAATADDPDAFDTVTVKWTVSESDYYALFIDDAVVIRSSDATTDHTNVLGYAISAAPATIDFTNATYYTNHSADMKTADAAWSVKTGFNFLKTYADTWYKTGATRMVIDSTAKTMAGLAAGDSLYPTYEYAKLQRVTTTNGVAAEAETIGYARMIFGKIDLSNAFVYETEEAAQVTAPYGEAYTGATKTAFKDTADLYLLDGWFGTAATAASAAVDGTITGVTQKSDVYSLKEHVNYVTFMDGETTIGYGILDTDAATVLTALDFTAVPFTAAKPEIGTENETAAKNMTFTGTDAYKKAGRTLNGWYLNDKTFENDAVDTTAEVTAAAGDVFYLKSTASSFGGGGSAAVTQYPVKTAEPVHGNVKASVSAAEAGTAITFTVTPEDGYKVESVVVTDASGKEIPVTLNADGTYRLAMPASAVTVNATFSKVRETPEDTGVADWLICDAHDAYISGYADGSVQPQGDITRAEVAMIFYRLLKNKNVEITASFTDVPEGAWYAQAVNTLASIGVIKGVSADTFEPMRSITRAEFAAIATRLAKSTEGKATFTDVPETFWAYGSIAAAAAYGWVDGYADGSFAPMGKITRAEVAAIVNRMTGRAADAAYIKANPDQIKQFTDLQDASKWYYLELIEASNAHDFSKETDTETWSKVN